MLRNKQRPITFGHIPFKVRFQAILEAPPTERLWPNRDFLDDPVRPSKAGDAVKIGPSIRWPSTAGGAGRLHGLVRRRFFALQDTLHFGEQPFRFLVIEVRHFDCPSPEERLVHNLRDLCRWYGTDIRSSSGHWGKKTYVPIC